MNTNKETQSKVALDPKKKSFKDLGILYLKGFAMGSADVVPGVSGGTVAFISGIYDELLSSINKIDGNAIKLLFSFKIKELWQYVKGTFLLVLLAGIGTALVSMAKLISYLLENQPVPIWSFFFGLIVVSCIMVARTIKQWNVAVVASLLFGSAIAFVITIASPSETPEELWFVFVSGAIAICAMILPGISGSFIPLLMGEYKFILDSLNERNFIVLAVFGLGCLVGLLSFSRVVSWLLNKYHNLAVALLTGFMLGSLNKVWPWKIVTQYRTNSKGEQVPFLTQNVLPNEYADRVGEPAILWAVIFFLVGIVLVGGLEYWGAKMQKTDE